MREPMHVTCYLGIVLLLGALPVRAADTPQGISPGGIDRIAPIQGPCPTFNWQVAADAAGYEVAVYRIGRHDEVDADREPTLSEEERTMFLELPAGVGGWTPAADECFQPDTCYAWFVRSLEAGADGALTAGAWSRGRFFQTPAEPSASEVARAARVLRRYLEGGGSLAALEGEGVVSAHGDGAPNPADGARPRHVPVGAVKSVTTGTTAIKGTISDVVGETYGVVGINSSPAGAGVGAANTSGGADLVLDGSAQAEVSALLTEATLDRPSGAAQTFDVRNSSGGGMTLQVDGVDVVTALTDSDTTYSAGYGLDLAGTTFQVDVADFSAPPVMASDSTPFSLTTDYEDMLSATISIPASGYVIAHATGRCEFLNPDPSTNVMAESFSFLCRTADTNASTECSAARLSFALRNWATTGPVSTTVAFTNRLPLYDSGGDKTVYWNIKVFGAEDNVECYDRSLVLQYVPD